MLTHMHLFRHLVAQNIYETQFASVTYSILVRGSLSSQNKTPTYEKLKCKNFMSLALRHNLQQKKGSRGLEACVENMG